MVGYVNQNNLKVIIAYKQYTLFDPIFNTILQYSNDRHFFLLVVICSCISQIKSFHNYVLSLYALSLLYYHSPGGVNQSRLKSNI